MPCTDKGISTICRLQTYKRVWELLHWIIPSILPPTAARSKHLKQHMNKKKVYLSNLIPLSLHPVVGLENTSICEVADKANLSKVLFFIIWHSCQILVRSSQFILSLLSTFMLLCWNFSELYSNEVRTVQEGKYRSWTGIMCSSMRMYVDRVRDSGWLEAVKGWPLTFKPVIWVTLTLTVLICRGDRGIS